MFKSIHSPENLRLITWLREQREAQNLTMRDLAAKLKIQHTLIGRVELGERRLDVVEYIQYCNALKVSPVDGINIILSKND